MRRLAPLLLACFLLLFACGPAKPASIPETTTEVPTTNIPLPDNCQLLKDKSSHAIEYFADQPYWLRGDRTRLSPTKELFTRFPWETDGAPQLLLRDEITGEELIIAEGASSSAPHVAFIIDERYIVWTDNFKDNGFGGIYDTKRVMDISWGESAFPAWLYDNALWFEPTYYKHREAGPLILYRVPLDRLDTMDKIDFGGNMLEGIPGNDFAESHFADSYYSTALSPDCRYYAVCGASIGIYIFDLQERVLVQQIPAEVIPGPALGHAMPDLGFYASPWQNSDSTILCCYGDEDVLEITLP